MLNKMLGTAITLLTMTGSAFAVNFPGQALGDARSAMVPVQAPPNGNISPPAWYQMFVLDGPTPSHSVWVRIGGDPAGIGNWPNLPGFTTPGV